MSVDSDTDDVYVIWLRSGTAYYNKNDGTWGGETNTNWTEGTSPAYLNSNYQAGGSIFAQWVSGTSSPFDINWDTIIVIPEHLWLFFGLGPILPLLFKRKRRIK